MRTPKKVSGRHLIDHNDCQQQRPDKDGQTKFKPLEGNKKKPQLNCGKTHKHVSCSWSGSNYLVDLNTPPRCWNIIGPHLPGEQNDRAGKVAAALTHKIDEFLINKEPFTSATSRLSRRNSSCTQEFYFLFVKTAAKSWKKWGNIFLK